MIFDRTIQDVINAINIRDTKVKNFETLTNEELETLEKGFFTHNSINRIYLKERELRDLLHSMGYWNTSSVVIYSSWPAGYPFKQQNLNQIFDNAEILRKAFFVYKTTPNTPSPAYHFENINALEKILHDLERMVEEIKSFYIECGTFECGE